MPDVDFAAYNSGNVMILEYPKPYFWMLVVLLFLSFVGIPLALYTTSIYETEGKKDGIDWHNRGVSYSTFTILGILSLLIVVFLGYSIYNRAKRNIVDSNEKLQDEAAKIYAHAYGEKAKEIATESGGGKLQGFKEQMYKHLMSVFDDNNMKTVQASLKFADNDEEAGRGVASTSGAKNITDSITASAGGTEGNVAAATEAAATAAAEQRRLEEAAAAATAARGGGGGGDAAAEAPEAGADAAVEEGGDGGEGTATAPVVPAAEDGVGGEGRTLAQRVANIPGARLVTKSSPISLSRASRRRKSPVKKKKASPTKKKKSPSSLKKKKKSTSSRRK